MSLFFIITKLLFCDSMHCFFAEFPLVPRILWSGPPLLQIFHWCQVLQLFHIVTSVHKLGRFLHLWHSAVLHISVIVLSQKQTPLSCMKLQCCFFVTVNCVSWHFPFVIPWNICMFHVNIIILMITHHNCLCFFLHLLDVQSWLQFHIFHSLHCNSSSVILTNQFTQLLFDVW